MTKTQSSKIHFKKRFKERFGIEINRNDIRELVSNIKEGSNVIKSDILSLRVTAYTMIFKRKRCVILYDKIRKVPVTALTMDMDYTSYSE
jgi:hypothetical protein